MADFKSFSESEILIVGGAGFVGSNLCLKLLEHKPKRITIIDNLISSESSNIPDSRKIDFIYGSIADDRILFKLPDNLDYVFHLSCYHGNQSSIADPIADHDNNTFTTLKLFDRLKDIKSIKRIVYSAAGCAVAEKTYGTASATSEDAPVTLYHDSPYSISKIIGEMYGNYYHLQYDLPFVKARFQNVYGPREILGAGSWRLTPHTVWRNVTPAFIYKSLNNQALQLDNGGLVTRDFIFVEDLAEGLMRCAIFGEPGGVYNLATGIETTIKTLAELINEITGNIEPLDLQPARDWDRSGCRYGSTEKSERELGFIAKTSLLDGLKTTITWTKNNIDYINTCILRHSRFMPNIK